MLLAVGCSSFRTGDLPEITGWPPSPATSDYNIKVVNISTKAEVTVNGAPRRTGGQLINMLRDSSIDAYNNSGLFRLANPRYDYESDYNVEILLKDDETIDSLQMLLSALTLFIKEGRATDRYTLITTIKDKKGVVLDRIEKTDTLVYKQRVGLFFSVFTRLPDVVSRESLYDLNRSTIQEALSKGVFK